MKNNKEIQIQFVPIELCDYNEGQIPGVPENPRTREDAKQRNLEKSIEELPEMTIARAALCYPYNGRYVVIGGNRRLEAQRALKRKEVPIIALPVNTPVEKLRRIALLDNESTGQTDWNKLAKEWDKEEIKAWNIETPKGWGGSIKEKLSEKKATLSERFLVPPFSVFETKQGYWQNRKKEWLSLGIKSELGRDNELTYSVSCQSLGVYEIKNHLRQKLGREPNWEELIQFCDNNGIKLQNGTSIFDPVVCELCYRWFNIDGGKILDPFAGGSVRGIVASKLGYAYFGNDLRKEQIEANIQNAKEIINDSEVMPKWTSGDSCNIDKIIGEDKFDMVFSCPPYADLEKYSDDPKDLSNMKYDDFKKCYFEIIGKCCKVLKDNRFAVFVVGEVRDKKGNYFNFVGDTVNAFQECGLNFYNEIILLRAPNSAAMKAGRHFNSGRKVAKIHQNVLVFYKGDPKNIKKIYNPIDLSNMGNE